MEYIACDDVECPLASNSKGAFIGKHTDEQLRQHILYHISRGFPAVISSSRISAIMPKRIDFLDQKIVAQVDDAIANRLPLPIRIVTHAEKDIGGNFSVSVFGVLACGRKFHAQVWRVPVVVDVLVVEPYFTVSSIMSELGPFVDGYPEGVTMKAITDEASRLRRIRGFSKTKSAVVRFTFAKAFIRKMFLTYVKERCMARKAEGKPIFETSSDKINHLFAMLAAQNEISTAGWNTLSDYNYKKINPSTPTGVLYFSIGRITDIKSLDGPMPGYPEEIFTKDSTLACSWDTETRAKDHGSGAPMPGDDGFDITSVGMVFHWHWSQSAVMNVCISRYETNASPELITVVATSTVEVVSSFKTIAESMLPDFWIGFNCGGYDWPNLFEMSKKNSSGPLLLYKSLAATEPYQNTQQDNLYKWSLGPEKIKYSAEFTAVQKMVIRPEGSVHIDLMHQLGKLFPRAEIERGKSLNWYLAKYNLESKYDMEYLRMHYIFKRAFALSSSKVPRECHCGTRCRICDIHYPKIDGDKPSDKCCACTKRPQSLKDMAEVNYYCYRDCLGPMRLNTASSLTVDKCELACLGYVPLYDAFYRADGNKVEGRLIHVCAKERTAYSSLVLSREAFDIKAKKLKKDFYPGGKVFPPVYGLHGSEPLTFTRFCKLLEGTIGRPIVGLDFASLYPSLMRDKNICVSTLVDDIETAKQLAKEGYAIYEAPPINYETGIKRGDSANTCTRGRAWFVRHNGAIKPGDPRVSHWDKYVTYTWIDGGVRKSVSFRTAKILSRSATASVETPLDIDYIHTHNSDEMYVEDAYPEDQEKHEEFLRTCGRESCVARFDGKIIGNTMVRTVDRRPVTGGPSLPGEYMGIFPRALSELYDMRNQIKKELGVIAGLKKQMAESHLDKIEYRGRECTLADLSLEYAKIDGKQKALKVIMNTFYGKTGQQHASFYSVLVAAAITLSGQDAITRVANRVSSGLSERYVLPPNCGVNGKVADRCMDVMYGDTDSNYVAAGKSYFETVDKTYEAAKSGPPEDVKKARFAWQTSMIQITRDACELMREECNDLMMAWTGSPYLTLAYEEVLYPTMFCGKKKYAGLEHKDEINFFPKPKEIFVRGLDIVKQGTNDVVRNVGYSILAKALHPENTRSLIDITLDEFRAALNDPMSAEALSQKARYKPEKANIPVQTFVRRMREAYETCTDPEMRALYAPPPVGDKFDYVIVDKGVPFTLSGTRIELKKGDRMEYLRVFQASKGTMKLDLPHYVRKGGVIGICARFILSSPMFEPVGMFDMSDNEQFTQYDGDRRQLAVNYLEKIADEHFGYSATAINALGVSHRAKYRVVAKEYVAHIEESVGRLGAQTISSYIREPIQFSQALEKCQTTANSLVTPAEVERCFRALGKDEFAASVSYTRKPRGIHWQEMAEYEKLRGAAREKMLSAFEAFHTIASVEMKKFEQYVYTRRKDNEQDYSMERLSDEERSVILNYNNARYDYTAILIAVARGRALYEYCLVRKANLVNAKIPPARETPLSLVGICETEIPFSCGF